MKILLADDDPVNRRMLGNLLAEGDYHVVFAENGEEAYRILSEENAPKLAVLDWLLPQRDGIEICREIRKWQNDSYTYILLLTGNLQLTQLVAGLNAGADDYLTKPFNPGELLVRLRAGKRIVELQDELRSVHKKLQFQASHDPLTSIANRAAIMEILEAELARARRQHETVGILLVDVDHFKQVNESCGHHAGDAVLREVVGRMLVSVRCYDAIGRYGGEEFLIVVPRCDAPTLISRAEQLRVAIAAQPINTPEGLVSVTVSVGVTVAAETALSDVGQILRAADTALNQAKSKGRNCVLLHHLWPDERPKAMGLIRSPRVLQI